MSHIQRETVITDDAGDSVSITKNSDGALLISTDDGRSVELNAPAVRALIAAVTAPRPGTES